MTKHIRLESYKKYIDQNTGPFLVVFSVIFMIYILSPLLQEGYSNAGDNYWHTTVSHQFNRFFNEEKSFFGFFHIMQTGQPLPYLYQPLFYIFVTLIHKITFFDIVLSEKILIILTVSLYPLSIYYFMIKFNFSKTAAGFAAIFSITSNAMWGNNITAYFIVGIITQALGMLFFPIILAIFYESMKKNRFTIILPILLSLSMIAHFLVNFMLWNCINLLFIILLLESNKKIFIFRVKKYIAIFLLMLVFSSFWLIPFLQLMEIRSTEVLTRTGQFISGVQRNGYDIDELIEGYFTGRIFDVNGGELERHKFFNNSDLGRLPFLTIFSILGLIGASLQMKKTGNSFLSFGFLMSFLFVAGSDDIPLLGLVPFQKQMYFIRVTCVFEFFTVCLAGYGLYKFLNVLEKILFKNKIGFLSICLALILPTIIFGNLLVERNNVAHKIVQNEYIYQGDMLKKLFSKTELSDSGRIYTGRETDYFDHNKQPLLAQISDIPTIMTPNWEQYYSQQLLWDIVVQNNDNPRLLEGIPYKRHLRDLYNIKYIVSKSSWENEGRRDLVNEDIRKISSTRVFSLFEVVENYTYFSFLKNKPILMVCSSDTWLKVGKKWLMNYQKTDEPDKFPFFQLSKTKKLDNLEFNADRYPITIILDHEISDHIIVDGKIKKYEENGGKIIYMNDSRYIQEKSNPSWVNIGIPQLDEINFSAKISNQIVGKQSFSFDYYSSIENFVIFKISYFPGWNIEVDGEKTSSEFVTPGFVGFWVPSGNHKVKIDYDKGVGKTYILFLIIGVGIIWTIKKYKLLDVDFEVENNNRDLGDIFQILFLLLILYICFLYVSCNQFLPHNYV